MASIEAALKKHLPKILADDEENGEDMYSTIIELVMEDVEETNPEDASALEECVRPVLEDDFAATIDDAALQKFVEAVFPPKAVDTSSMTRTAAARQKKLEAAARKAERKELEAAILAREGESGAVAVDSDEEDDGKGPQGEDVILDGFNIFMGGKQLYQNASMTLAKGNRYGLVGPNGCGKSTLLNHISRREGEFRIPAHIDTMLVEQEIEFEDLSAIEFVIRSDKRRLRYLEKKEQLEAKLETMEDGRAADAVSDQLNEVYEKLEEMGADAAEARASAILSGLQFTEEMKLQSTLSFSGGWRMRISLARALFIEPRLLLLDEPTNHLDLHAVIWLEAYLQTYKHTILIVSHDRDFLSTVTTHIYHVWDMNLVLYKGNFDLFEVRFQAFLDEYNSKIEAKDKRVRKEKRAGTYKPQEGDKDKKIDIRPIKLRFEEPTVIESMLVTVDEMTFGYPGGANLFEDVSFGISTTSRIALVGPNGTGKSTLLKLITGDLEPKKGTITIDRKVRFAVFSQHFIDQLDLDLTPIQYLRRQFPTRKEQEIRQYLGMYGLNGDQHKQVIGTLSGGQKSRVVFVELSFSNPHVIILDEPTNNLDIETNDALADALSKFPGGVVLVTHSPALISGACNTVWICSHDKSVSVYPGTFDEYRDDLIIEMREILRDMDEEKARSHGGGRRKQSSGAGPSSAVEAAPPSNPFANFTIETETLATLMRALPDLSKRPGMLRFSPFDGTCGPEVWSALSDGFSSIKATMAFARVSGGKKKRRKKKKKGGEEEEARPVVWDVAGFVQVPAREWYYALRPSSKHVVKYVEKISGGFFNLDVGRLVEANYVNEATVAKQSRGAVSICASDLDGSECIKYLSGLGSCLAEGCKGCKGKHVFGHEGLAVSMTCTRNMISEDGCTERSCKFSHLLKGGAKRGDWYANRSDTVVVDGDGWRVECEPANLPGRRIKQLMLVMEDSGEATAAELSALPDTRATIESALLKLGVQFATVWIESAETTNFTLVFDDAEFAGLVERFPMVDHLGATRYEDELWEAIALARDDEVRGLWLAGSDDDI